MGNIFYLTLCQLTYKEQNFERFFTTLRENLDLIGRCLTFDQRKDYLQKYLLTAFLERNHAKLQNSDLWDLVAFEGQLRDPLFSKDPRVKQW